MRGVSSGSLCAGAVGLAVVLAAAGSAPARAADAPDPLAFTNELLAGVTAQAVPSAEGEKAEVMTPREFIQGLRGQGGVNGPSRITFSRASLSSRAVTAVLPFEEEGLIFLAGGVYTEKYFPGAPGVEGGFGRVYSKVFPYFLTSDLVVRTRVSVQAFTRSSSKKYVAASAIRTVSVAGDYRATPVSTTPPQDLNDGPFETPSSVAGYELERNALYVRTRNLTARVRLKASAVPAARRGVYLKVITRFSKTPGSEKLGKEYGKQPVGYESRLWPTAPRPSGSGRRRR